MPTESLDWDYSLGFMNPIGLRCVVVSFCFMASSVKAT